ncbi:porin [Paraburkholderia xenovorans]|uniref:porin n=1 Tax=Paraburkholderia xenovorans TaxID=36873 RepID=UPI0038BC317B
MKKSIFALAALASIAGAAHAQSSVTLYGIVDGGFLFLNNANGQRLYSTSSGNMQGSRWGLRGAEDIGGGTQVTFNLQNGFNMMNGTLGQGGDEFGRAATVGIASNRFGAVTIGRQYDPLVDFTGPFEAASLWAPFYAAHPGDLDNMNGFQRVNSAIKYRSIDYGGFKFSGMYSLGGVAGQFSRNQIWTLAASYDRGPLSMAAAFMNARDPNFSFFGNNATSSATGSNMTSRVYSGYASAKTQQIFTFGSLYKFGNASFNVTYSNTQFKDLGAQAALNPLKYSGSAMFHNVEAGVSYLLVPSLTLGIAYDYTKGYGVNDAIYQQVTTGIDYFLSKRTDLYASGIYQHAAGTDSTGARAVANLAGASPSSTPNQLAVIVGIRHKF